MPPCISGRNGKDAAAELEALQEQQKEAADAADTADKQPAGSADQRKQKKRARKEAEAEAAAAAERQRQLEEEVSEAQWRRASALRRSRLALLAEMTVWEREAEDKEAAAEAGIVSDTAATACYGFDRVCSALVLCCMHCLNKVRNLLDSHTQHMHDRVRTPA